MNVTTAAIFTTLLAAATCVFAESPQPASPADAYTVAAYYFGNYHVDPRNEKQHGPGWTEWDLVRQAIPRFEGHQQPKVPLWGSTTRPTHRDGPKIAPPRPGIDAYLRWVLLR